MLVMEKVESTEKPNYFKLQLETTIWHSYTYFAVKTDKQAC